jgi:hypothetical protein
VKSFVVSDEKLEGAHPKKINALKKKNNGAAPAHTRSEVRRKRSRGNVTAQVEELRTEVVTRLRVELRELMGSGFAFVST